MSQAKQTSSWPIVQVDTPQFAAQINLFKELRTIQAPGIRQLAPRICLQCWMVVGLDDSANHKGHNQTSDFSQMEEANRTSFLGLCKQYDRLTPDNKQVILMKVQPKILQLVDLHKQKKNGAAATPTPPPKVGPGVSEVDLTNAIPPKKSSKNGKKQIQQEQSMVGKKRTATEMDISGVAQDPSQMMMNFPSMFNQFMMNSMGAQQQPATAGKGKGKQTPAKLAQAPQLTAVHPQTEQFQIKMVDMVKKLQKKCDQIFKEVSTIKQQIYRNGIQADVSQQNSTSQDVVEVVEDKVQAELNRIREENKKKAEVPLQIENPEVQNKDQEMQNAKPAEPEEIKATEEVKAAEPVVEKTPEELEKDKLEKEELIKKRQKMLMDLAGNGNEEMDFGEGPEEEAPEQLAQEPTESFAFGNFDQQNMENKVSEAPEDAPIAVQQEVNQIIEEATVPVDSAPQFDSAQAAPSENTQAAPAEIPQAAATEVIQAPPADVPQASPTEVPEAAPAEVPQAAPSEVQQSSPSEIPQNIPTEVAQDPLAGDSETKTQDPNGVSSFHQPQASMVPEIDLENFAEPAISETPKVVEACRTISEAMPAKEQMTSETQRRSQSEKAQVIV